jgi:O-antigen ligase
MTINIKNILPAITKHWPCLLILLAFIGFVSKSLYNYPVGIMAILGLYQLIRTPKILLHDYVLKIFSLVFLCLWLPLLISFPDAVNIKHSAHTVFPYLRFFFAGIFIITELSKDPERLKFVVICLFYIVLFWCIDATIQFFINKNLLGFPYISGNITGMFYPRNAIGHVCSVLSSFIFLYLYLKNKKVLYTMLLPLFFIILLSGSRASWIMMGLSSVLFVIYMLIYTDNRKGFIKNICFLFAAVIILLSTTITFHPSTNNRFKSTMGLFSGDYNTINHATAIRLPIWETAFSIFKSNPINGIGPRGFRHIYENYAAPDDHHVAIDIIPTQPHIIILEILAETGLIGVIGYIFAFYLIIRFLQHSKSRKDLIPFCIPVVVSMFPFNAHMAFYGSIWSSMTWLLLTLYFTKVKLSLGKD